MATALVLAVCSLGIPLPGPVKETDEAFPCMDCPCACAEAKTCWQNCCCMTDAEKLVWAARNGVVPPGFVVARAKTCPQPGVRSCCSKGPAAGSPAIESPATEVAGPGAEPVGVLVWKDLECRGLAMGWLVAIPTLSADESDSIHPAETPPASVCVRSPLFSVVLYDHDTPPPQGWSA